MKKLWATTLNDGSVSVWYYDKDEFVWGTSTKWIPWWVISPNNTVDYCTILGLDDPSIICSLFDGDSDLVDRLWEIHNTYKRSGMRRGIKI